MANRRRRVVNGMVFFIVNNESTNKIDVLGANEELIDSIPQSAKSEKALARLLESIAVNVEEEELA